MSESKQARALLTNQVTQLASLIPTVDEPTARDWKGFLAALIALAMQILPIILPLFAEEKPT